MRYVGHASGYVLGFHGCDRSVGERVLAGDQDLVESTNSYDWLGHGIYFWEGNIERAKRWAEDRKKRKDSSIEDPFVVGAIIDLGHCFSLLQTDHLEMLRDAHRSLVAVAEAAGRPLPKNSGGRDRLMRRLDCAVVQMVHRVRQDDGEQPFDTVRGMFQEGSPLYQGAGFSTSNHIQICVRNRQCIKGYFRPLED